MNERILAVRLKAEYAGFKAAMADVRNETDKTSANFDRNGNKITTTTGRIIRSAELNRDAWDRSGRMFTLWGLSTVAALGLAARAAIQWESDWTGVLKTVSGSHDELAALEGELRALALVKPASQGQIAAVAEAAGQLGVATASIAKFTSVMVDLGETTNLTADEAATSIAQLMNVMQTAPENVDRVGAALVALGNNGASTERDIIQMAQRIAGAGKIIGLTESEVLGLSNALASVGIEVEAGGSAISNVMIDISKAVSGGGEELTTWAEVAGMSAQDFAAAWKSDPAEALVLITEGLGRMNASGGDVLSTLDALGQSDVRVTRALLSMSGAGDLLRKSIDMGNESWDANTALVIEAGKRYDTTEAKVAMARNALNETAITIGEDLLPTLASLAEGVANVAGWFSNLPDPVRQAATGISGVVAVAALATGGFLMLVPRVVEARKAIAELSVVSPRAASGLGKMSKAAGYAGLAGAFIAIAIAAKQGIDAIRDASPDIVDVRNKLVTAASGADLLSSSMVSVGSDMEGFRKIADELKGDRWWEFGATAADWVGSSVFGKMDFEKAADEMRVFDDAISGFASIDLSAAQKQFNLLADGFGAVSDEDFSTILDALPTFRDSLVETATSLGLTADDATLLALATGEIKGSATDATIATDTLTGATGNLEDGTVDYTKALQEQLDLQRTASGVALDQWDALTQYADAVSSATAALYDENDVLVAGAATLDQHTAAGRANRDALSELATSTWNWVESGKAAGESTTELSSRLAEGRQAFIDTAIQMGINEDQAAALADEMGLIPNSILTTFQTPGLATALSQVNQLNAALKAGTGHKYTVEGSWLGGPTFATGGPVLGPGTGTSDSIFARLSNGEYVQRTAAHQFWGSRAMSAMNNLDVGGFYRALAARGFADGGSPSAINFPGISMSGGSPNVTVDMAGALAGMSVVVDIGGQPFAGVIRAVVDDANGTASANRMASMRGR